MGKLPKSLTEPTGLSATGQLLRNAPLASSLRAAFGVAKLERPKLCPVRLSRPCKPALTPREEIKTRLRGKSEDNLTSMTTSEKIND